MRRRPFRDRLSIPYLCEKLHVGQQLSTGVPHSTRAPRRGPSTACFAGRPRRMRALLCSCSVSPLLGVHPLPPSSRFPASPSTRYTKARTAIFLRVLPSSVVESL